MKRSNFTFLFLFCLLGLFSQNVLAQTNGNACNDEINVSVEADCSWTVTKADLGSAATDADSLWVEPHDPDVPRTFTGSGTAAVSGFYFNFKTQFPKGHYVYEVYEGDEMVCWGHLNIEHKKLPPTETCRDTVDCIWYEHGGYDWKKYNLYDELAKGCYAWPKEGTSVKDEVVHVSTADCGDDMYVRTVSAVFAIDKKKETVYLRRDTLVVTPIEKEDVCYPHNWVEVDCKILGDNDFDPTDKNDHDAISEWLSPARISGYFKAQGNTKPDTMAGPYVKKPHVETLDSMEYCSMKMKMATGDSTLVQVTGHDGEDYWTKVPVYDYVCIELDTIKVVDCENAEHVPAIIGEGDPIGLPADHWRCLGSCTDTTYVPKLLPKGNKCNIHVKCTDWVVEGQCHTLPTVMRNWEVIDWCDPTKSVWEYTQWIKVVDHEAPVWTKEPGDVWVGIAPWTCAGEFHWKPSIKDWSDYHVEYTVSEGYVETKDHGKEVWFKGLWMQACPIEVTAKAVDYCGNYSERTFYVYLKDEVAPVVVTHDEISVTLTGDHETSEGVAKVYADAIDNGSHDAGCGKVTKCVLRKDELADPIKDYYGNYVYDADGNQCYHAKGCYHDHEATVLVGFTNNGKTPQYEKYPAVICKEYVKFCCEDDYAITGEFVQVALVVTDQASKNPCPAGGHDYYDNYSHGWANVRVENKHKPIVECVDGYVSCNDNPYEPGALKAPKAWSICGEVALTADQPTGKIDQCGKGEIEVVWRYADGTVACTQTLYGHGYSDFDPETIKWPKHQDGTSWDGYKRECEALDLNGDGRADRDRAGNIIYGVIYYPENVKMGEAQECNGTAMGAPTWCNPSCTLIEASYSEDFDYSASDVCKKMIRRWTVIDWCTWKPNGNNVDDENDSDYERFEPIDDTWMPNPVAANRALYEPCTDCEKVSGTADDIYIRYKPGYVERDGYYTYDQVIKIIDNTAPTFTTEADSVTVNVVDGNASKLPADYDATAFAGCVGSDDITLSAADMCNDVALDSESLVWWIERTEVDGRTVKTATANGESATMSTGVGAPGQTTTIKWLVRDGCGNTATTTTVVTFVDAKAPTPVCLQDISTATMNVDGSSVAIWASDYDLGSFDNCSDVNVYFKDEDGNEVSSLSFGCEDIPNGVSGTIPEIKMYVSDEYGNEDFCYVTLRIDDNADICPNVDGGAAAISGEVRTAIGDMIESARVSLNKSNVDETSVDGKFAFNGLAADAYELTSTKSDDYMNGVSALDLVLIQKHVLGITALNDAYKVIAADVNNDGKVSSKDLVELRKLILGVYTELPNNASWRFVDASQTFADANNPFPFTEAVSLSVNGDNMNQDFIGTKTGDVSGNAIANSLIAAGTRSAGTINLEMTDAAFAAGDVFSVDVTSANFSDVAAYQFTMDVKGLEFVGVESGALAITSDNFAQLDASTITSAWYSTEGVTSSDVLFTLTFRATAAGQLSSAVALSSAVTAAEAYTASADKYDVAVAFNGVATSEFALMQNEPNPFSDNTTIAFRLAEAGSATLTVFDATGKTLSVVRGDYAKGMNQITLAKSDLNASGVLYYQLESGAFTATKKMVVIE